MLAWKVHEQMSFFSWKLRKIMQYLFLITKTLRVVAQIPGLKGSSNVTFPRQPFLPNTRKKMDVKFGVEKDERGRDSTLAVTQDSPSRAQ